MTTQNNSDTATPMRFASSELQKAIGLRAQQQCVATYGMQPPQYDLQTGSYKRT